MVGRDCLCGVGAVEGVQTPGGVGRLGRAHRALRLPTLGWWRFCWDKFRFWSSSLARGWRQLFKRRFFFWKLARMDILTLRVRCLQEVFAGGGLQEEVAGGGLQEEVDS